ncbi:MAG: zinc ribbon domain-containing protein [Christensenellaceae bacterium]|nr:zinc ribbon domain-containing protein [Christensenellaceae bacterium]
MNAVLQNRKLITLGAFGAALAFTLIFAVYSTFGVGVSGFQVMFEANFFAGLLLIIAPIGGLVVELVLSNSMDSRMVSIIHLALGVVGIIMLFVVKGMILGEAAAYIGSMVSLGFGAVIALLGYIVAASVNAFAAFGADLFTGSSKAASSVSAKCPNCGRPVAAGKAFCANCGARLK